eukprot:scaffold114433_cov24-Tisochrysis_lutea.AAC.2
MEPTCIGCESAFARRPCERSIWRDATVGRSLLRTARWYHACWACWGAPAVETASATELDPREACANAAYAGCGNGREYRPCADSAPQTRGRGMVAPLAVPCPARIGATAGERPPRPPAEPVRGAAPLKAIRTDLHFGSASRASGGARAMASDAVASHAATAAAIAASASRDSRRSAALSSAAATS